ncbi:MAG: type II toxin-antitoxin system HicB family antitoxin [Candidatus Peribacteria bacterium]|jgi:predicted RNase H-like HicB family nuclease|nr:type II toxin-antitoxin system HicB family antitoxin [Candidatus Peribacteria bacterium]
MSENTFIFNVLLTKEDSWYIAKCIENNVTSQGKTIEEAVKNLQEAIELFYEDDYKDIPYEISNIFLTTIKVDLP